MEIEQVPFDKILRVVREVDDGEISKFYNNPIRIDRSFLSEDYACRNLGQIILRKKYDISSYTKMYSKEETDSKRNSELEFSRLWFIMNSLRGEGYEPLINPTEDEEGNPELLNMWNIDTHRLVYDINLGKRHIIDQTTDLDKDKFRKKDLLKSVQFFDRIFIGFSEEKRPLG